MMQHVVLFSVNNNNALQIIQKTSDVRFPVCQFFKSEVQKAQRVAFTGIVDKQNGHSLVVTSSTGSSFFLFNRLTLFMTMNTANATMTKLIIVFMNMP